ncbi:cadherin EGF LAG seven-pass G-type receptor 1-like [Ptychodera flava]|uniref:cadherin EGF LAG seven-pass G-type receptor 1-like n=1 Tax=Ptychodera flava TaxID=63121 RepID=UPI00396A2831
MGEVAQITSNVTVGGDLLVAGDILLTMEKNNALAMEGSSVSKQGYIEEFVKVANRLLAVDKESHWRAIHAALGPEKGAIRVFEALQKYSDDISKHLQTEDIGVYLDYENIEYRAFKPGETDVKMRNLTFKGLNRRKRNSISKNVLNSELKINQDILSGRSDVSMIIAYVYHNPGDILPVKKKRSPSAEMVKSITATKKIQKVNSPVVAVKMYSENSVYRNPEPVILKFPHKELGYDPKCVAMRFKNPQGVWKTNECLLLKSQSGKDHTSCKCPQPTVAAVVMTIGTRKEPFLVAARDVIITITNCLSFLLILITFVIITISRLDTEQYYVIRHYTMAFLPMPFFIFLGGLTAANGVRSVSTAVIQYSFLSTTAWTLNLSIEAYKRLARSIHTSKKGRFVYTLNGWILPFVVVLLSLWCKYEIYHDRHKVVIGE